MTAVATGSVASADVSGVRDSLYRHVTITCTVHGVIRCRDETELNVYNNVRCCMEGRRRRLRLMTLQTVSGCGVMVWQSRLRWSACWRCRVNIDGVVGWAALHCTVDEVAVEVCRYRAGVYGTDGCGCVGRVDDCHALSRTRVVLECLTSPCITV